MGEEERGLKFIGGDSKIEQFVKEKGSIVQLLINVDTPCKIVDSDGILIAANRVRDVMVKKGEEGRKRGKSYFANNLLNSGNDEVYSVRYSSSKNEILRLPIRRIRENDLESSGYSFLKYSGDIDSILREFEKRGYSIV